EGVFDATPEPVEESPIKIKGDCIDSKRGVQVCPPGIDIRDGVQLECVHCTACIDACDEIMDKIDRPRGLIRYDSFNGVESKRRKIFTGRVIAYTIVLVLLIAVNIVLLSNRGVMETVVLRTPGMLFQKVDETHISNLYNYQIFNKTEEDMTVELRLRDNVGNIRLVGEMPVVKASEMTEGAFFIDMETKKLKDRSNKIVVEVWADGKIIDEARTNFLGPIK
ncbi:MAG TPA: FixG Ig-like domain-containing protein, partial [Flavilitoribacter sp.]|nr:FixG Ig-like domain-containing protein [Flavilitoribacter sp.]